MSKGARNEQDNTVGRVMIDDTKHEEPAHDDDVSPLQRSHSMYTLENKQEPIVDD